MSESNVATTGAWDAGECGVSVESVAWDDPRAVALRAAMDEELRPRYADRWEARAPGTIRAPAGMQVDPADLIVALIAVEAGGRPVGHAALRWLDGRAEVKRVFVDKGSRGTGVSVRLMLALEAVARDYGAAELILQTGDRQPEAVGLYVKLGYQRIPIFPPYEALPHSKCFAKTL
jgi:GNAT superfamily N-acetyltransferase